MREYVVLMNLFCSQTCVTQLANCIKEMRILSVCALVAKQLRSASKYFHNR